MWAIHRKLGHLEVSNIKTYQSTHEWNNLWNFLWLLKKTDVHFFSKRLYLFWNKLPWHAIAKLMNILRTTYLKEEKTITKLHCIQQSKSSLMFCTFKCFGIHRKLWEDDSWISRRYDEKCIYTVYDLALLPYLLGIEVWWTKDGSHHLPKELGWKFSIKVSKRCLEANWYTLHGERKIRAKMDSKKWMRLFVDSWLAIWIWCEELEKSG